MEAILFGLMGAVAAGTTYANYNAPDPRDEKVSEPPLPASVQPMRSECEDEENCRDQIQRENAVPGRFDNLPRQKAVYATPDSDLDCAPMKDLGWADNPLAWGIMPQGNRTLGFARPEFGGADLLRAPRRDVLQEEMWAPIGNPNVHWAETEERGKALAREHEMNSANRKANAPEGAFDGFTPFDFDSSGAFIGHHGFRNGQFMQERPTTDNRRIIYRGPNGPRKRVKDSIYSFRPGAGRSLVQGVPGGIGRVQEPGRGHSKTQVRDDYRRDPVPTSSLTHKRPAIGEVVFKHQNRQSGCLHPAAADNFFMEELKAK